MAEFLSRQATNLASRIKVPPTDYGKVQVAVATTPAVAAWAQNDTFVTGIRIPAGSRILRTGRASHSAFGSSVTMDVGIRALDGTVVDVDGIADGLNVASAGASAMENGSLFASGVAYVTDQEVEVYVTFLGANPTDNAQLELEVHWVGPTP
jgi:hypothetical protein